MINAATPPPPPPPSGGNAVVKFVLWNADSDAVIGDLNNGASLDLAALCGGCQVNIQAVAADPEGATQSMSLTLSGGTNASRTESGAPYMLAGDTGGNIFPMSFGSGAHTLTATPFSANRGGGTAGTSLTIGLTVQ